MTKLQALIKQFQEAISRLKEVLELKKNEVIRDSAIQRFEFTFDLSWKLIKSFLEENKGIICRSPKECFRESFKQKIIDYDNFWIEITNARNRTAHLYKKEMAEEVFAILPKALTYFQKLLENIQKELE